MAARSLAPLTKLKLSELPTGAVSGAMSEGAVSGATSEGAVSGVISRSSA